MIEVTEEEFLEFVVKFPHSYFTEEEPHLASQKSRMVVRKNFDVIPENHDRTPVAEIIYHDNVHRTWHIDKLTS